MPDVRLTGCTSRPLLGYLKALGVLQAVSAQADSQCRARWHAGALELRSDLSEKDLKDFLQNGYAPSPVVSPWNGGSGFHPNDNKEAIAALEASGDPRFAAYQEALASTRATLAAEGITDKPTTKDEKLRLIRAMRRRLPDAALAWVDAAVVVTGDEPAYPPVLGSGGNDGRYDFSNNYAQAAVECLLGDQDRARHGLEAALTGSATELQRKLSLGHLSRDASPTNSPQGEAESLGNPWDLLLAVVGTLLLAAGAARRLDTAHRSTLVAPFTVHSTGAGYGSALTGEGRAELWLPLWSKWASLSEIVTLVRESRAQVRTGRSRRAARTGLDFARASGELGVARGVEAFERYAILERAGQANLAVPAGRISVAPRPAAAALSSIDQWLSSLERFASGDACPRTIREAVHAMGQAAFLAASRGRAGDVGALLEAMGATEHALAKTARSAAHAGIRPLRRAPATPWLEAADDGLAEFAVAASLASLRDHDTKVGEDRPALRDYLHGTRAGGGEFDPDRRHLVHGSSVPRLLAALHARRHLDATRHESTIGALSRGPRLSFTAGAPCPPAATCLFAANRLDDGRILRLLLGLSLLDHTSYYRGRYSSEAPADQSCPQPALETLILAWTPRRITGEKADAGASDRAEAGTAVQLGPRPGWAALLAAGRTAPVLRDALLRLREAQLPPVFNATDLTAGAPPGHRLSAALLVPFPRAQLTALERRLTIHTQRENEEAA